MPPHVHHRLVFHCLYYIPYLYHNCNSYVATYCCLPYVGLQIIFTYKIVTKLFKAAVANGKGRSKEKDGSDDHNVKSMAGNSPVSKIKASKD